MKKLTIILALVVVAFSTKAQYGNQFQYNAFFKTQGAFDYPSELGTDIRTFSVNLFGMNSYLGNSIADVNWLYNIATGIETGTIDGQSVPVLRNADGSTYLLPHVVLDHLVNNTPETNFLVGGFDVYTPLAIAFKVKAGEDKKEVVTFAFNHRIKTGTSTYLGKDLFKFMYNGIGSFGTDPANLVDFSVGFHAYSEWAFGMAFPVLELGNGMALRAGMNLKYLIGYAAIDTRTANLNLTNLNEGDVWDFNLDYLFNAAGPIDAIEDGADISPVSFARRGIGNGMGIDFGASLQVMENLKATMAVNDIGSIRYGNGNVINISGSGNVSFDGVRVNVFGLDSVRFNGDTLISRFEPEVTYNDFNVALPTRLTLSGEFGLNQKETRKGQEYFQHTIHFTYIQGFNKAVGNSTRPFVNVGYSYRLGNVLSTGVNTGYGGIYGFNIGGFVGLRGGPFRISFSSNALLGGMAPQLAKGFDFRLNMALAL
ncbi:MAG: hypothetical protein JXQ87_09205 [Bacteroidia bacterium]